MSKPAANDYPIHDLLRLRYSPLAFSPQPVEPAVLASLFEAARWAASSYNDQPWAFVVATRDRPDEYQRLLSCLVEGNRVWAGNAPVLVLAAARAAFAHNTKPNRHAYHDVGLAVGNLLVQATAGGLAVRQMAGILPDVARQTLGLPEGWDAVTGVAIGYPGDPAALPENLRQREAAPRKRKPLSEFVFRGNWGGELPF